MTEIIKVNDVVLIKTTQTYGKISAIQYEKNRYQLVDVSNWQHGINDLEKQTLCSLITTIESQQAQISGYKDVYHNEWLKQSAEKDALIESQKEEIAFKTHKIKQLESQIQWEQSLLSDKDVEIIDRNVGITEYEFYIQNIGLPAQKENESLKSQIESLQKENERLLAIIAKKEDRGADYFDQAITDLSRIQEGEKP